MTKKIKTEIQQAASTETASTPTVTSAKKAAQVKAKTPAKATGAAKAATVRSKSKKVAEVTPEPVVEVVAVAPLPVHDETELATQEVLDEREEIARIAYSYWVERRFAPGDPLHDWLRAEREFRVRGYASV